MRIAVIRKAHFNAAHRLHRPDWSNDENQKIFGLCSNPHFHGHNYDLEVKLTGEINQETGFCYDLSKLAKIIKTEIEDRFDHKNLNIECPEFNTLNPTTENIAIVIYNILRKNIEEEYEIEITLYETHRNYVKFPV